MRERDRKRERGAGRARRTSVAIGAALAVLILAGVGEARAAGPRVGLVVATHVNLSESDADLLASSLGEALRARLEVDVVAGADARRRLPAAGVPGDCVARLECVRDVATRLDGDELLFLFLVKIGTRLQIDSTWADPVRGAVASRTALVVEDTAEERARVLASAAPRLLPHAELRASARAAARDWESSAIGDSPPVDLERRSPRGRRFTAPVIVAGAVGAAALATGGGFAIAARLDHEALEEDGCNDRRCPGVDRRVDRMERKALAADVLFVTGGVALVTGAILFLASGESELRVRVEGGAGTGIVSFAGKF